MIKVEQQGNDGYEYEFSFPSWSVKLWNNPIALHLVRLLRLPIPFDSVMNFMWLTGDWNNIHYDIAAAEDSPIGCIALPGILAESIFSKILGTQFPGHGTIYIEKSIKFKRPLVANTTYRAVISVKALFLDSPHKFELSTEVFSLDNHEPYITGTATVVNKKICIKQLAARQFLAARVQF
jgi:hypothetical protein